MKKFFALFMCLVLCFSFAGCKNTEERNEEAKAALMKVLNKEEPFTIHNVDFNVTTQQYLENFKFPTNNKLPNYFAPCKYAFVDLDNDGVDELLVMDWLFSFLFLASFSSKDSSSTISFSSTGFVSSNILSS